MDEAEDWQNLQRSITSKLDIGDNLVSLSLDYFAVRRQCLSRLLFLSES